MEQNEYKWNVFVSHNRRQKPWVRQFVKHLRALNLEVFFDEDSMEPGDPILDTIEDNLKKSRHIVFIISPASVASKWVEMETANALFQDLDMRKKRIKPTLLEPTANPDIRSTLQLLNRVDLTNPQIRKDEYHRLLRSLLPDSAASPSSFPDPPIWPESTPLSSSFQIAHSGQAVAIGAHWDDILLGCLGTLLKLKLVLDYHVSLVVLCEEYRGYYGSDQGNLGRKVERIYRKLEERFNFKFEVGKDPSAFTPIEDRKFRDNSAILHSKVGELAKRYANCNLVFTPPVDDRHEDHAFTGELVSSYFRQPHHMKLEYEIKRYTDRSFVPNVFVRLDEALKDNICVGDLKVRWLSNLIAEGKDIENADTDTKIEASGFLFGAESLKARLLLNALDYGGDKNIRYGEAFRGRISI